MYYKIQSGNLDGTYNEVAPLIIVKKKKIDKKRYSKTDLRYRGIITLMGGRRGGIRQSPFL